MLAAIIVSALLADVAIPCDSAALHSTREASVAVLVQPGDASLADQTAITGPVTGEVKVQVGPTGTLYSGDIYKSTGNMVLDQALLRAARMTTYVPKLVNCVPTTSTYFYKFDFVPYKGDIKTITGNFRAFMVALIAKNPPTTGLTDKIAALLTPDAVAQISATYAPLGELEQLNLGNDQIVGDYHRYQYEAIFASGKRTVVFTTDKDGKIAGFFDITKP